MTAPRSRQAAPRIWRVPALLVACLAPVLAACSSAASRVQLPATAAAPVSAEPVSAAPGPPPALTARQRVIAALVGYTAALGQAEQSRSSAAARRLLHPYLAANRIGGLVRAISTIWASGEAFYGQDVLHVLTVRIEGRRALVHECDNTSGMGLENAVSGRAVPGSSGVAHDNLVTRLELARGQWLVESQLPEDVPCAP
jgi:hypothetical protein